MNVTPFTPLTSVKVIKGVPFDNSYKDVLDFSNSSDQISYFTSKAKETFTNIQPVRVSQNSVILPRVSDYFYDCNYIMFQNANFSNKWFYAFITKVDFSNINSSIISFEIDVYQTWLFDITLKESFIEREHSSTDAIGDNLVTENVDIGYYKERLAETTNFFNSYSVVLATSWEGSNSAKGGYIGGLYTGLKYIPKLVDNPTQVEELNTLLENLTTANKSDSITSVFMMPTMFYSNDDMPMAHRFDATKEQTKLGNYTPKNKKLLTYPYNFLYVFTPNGANSIYRYEFFQSQIECGFRLQCAMSCDPEIILEPIAYQGQQFNIDESMTLNGFPQCAYSIDSYKAFLAQNTSALQLSMVGSAVATGAGIMSGGATAGAMGLLGAASTVNSVVMASQKPPSVRGSQGNSTFTGTREMNFYFVNKHISEEYAKIIDNYFTMFGYATNRVKVPNTKTRQSFNYVKTRDIIITGSLSFDDMTKIKSIYNNGVTIWHGDYVGDYSRSNLPI